MTQTWRNWAGTEQATPTKTITVRNTDDVSRLLRAAAQTGQRVRPMGSGHSFTGIGSPESSIALDLSALTGIVDHTGDGSVTVRAGTPLHQLNAELDALGLAMPNLGDIDQQTISGAISTGTHGTGARLGGLATQVEALEIVLADGSVQRCSATENQELFNAARVGLGALGVISTVTLRCVPSFALAADERPDRLDNLLERLDVLADANDHFEFYWLPHGSYVLVKRNNRLASTEDAQPMGRLKHFFEYQVMENYAFGALCHLGRAVPRIVPPLHRRMGALLSARSYSDLSHRVFVTRRDVRFVESEYAIARESLVDVIHELRAAVGRLNHPVMFPVEVRVAAPDDIWLSTAYQRPTAYIAIHQFRGMPYREWFDTFESIMKAAGGRPHWGKMHQLTAADLRTRYPKFDDFCRVRATVDPQGVLRNPYLDRVLGATPVCR